MEIRGPGPEKKGIMAKCLTKHTEVMFAEQIKTSWIAIVDIFQCDDQVY
jgi:hypothetical protein